MWEMFIPIVASWSASFPRIPGPSRRSARPAKPASGSLSRWMSRSACPAAEPPLILALQREQADLRVAAANALARVGSAPSVLPLKEVAEHSWLDREFHRAARQAIAEIQARLQGASPGQLSLAGGEAGQLSLADAEAGQLSLVNDTGGQLSFSDAEEELKPSLGGAA